VTGWTPEFLDTNVLVYAFTADARAAAAQDLLARGCIVGVQTLNEFVSVARRKLAMTWGEIDEALSSLRAVCARIVPMDLAVHEAALAIARRHGLAIFDATVVAAALAARCETLWSEDMHDGLRIEDALRVRNPFL
jgi:predicted nucleic acid-binding protein